MNAGEKVISLVMTGLGCVMCYIAQMGWVPYKGFAKKFARLLSFVRRQSILKPENSYRECLRCNLTM